LLFINHPHPMWIFDLRMGRILAANEAALAQYGFTQHEFTNLCAKDLIAREAAEAFMADTAKPCSGLEHRGIWRHRKKDRSFVDVDVMTIDMRFGDSPARLVFAEDVSPRVLRETELCEAQRTRILRRVAEGVAHHFGQILTVVEGQAGLLREGRQQPDEVEHFEQMLSETRRGGALVRQLLAVGGCETIRPEPLDLNQWLQGQRPVLVRLLGERISLQLHLTDGLAPVLADARVLEWIVFNLVLNAREALPHGGCIDLHTDLLWIDPRQKQRPPGASPGHFIHLAVRDNGCGMPVEVQQHLFEPFFSTREDDKAMGLGLASVHGAAKQHGGWVEFSSEPQRGTEFGVYLPVASLAAQTTGIQEPAMPAPSRGTVMLVEADDRVRDLARHILQRNAYRVIEADNASTALLLLESQAQSVHLLLTDLAFPSGPDGRELASKLRLLKSDVKVVYSSAPLAPEDNEPGLLQEAKLLFKPYTPDQLLQTIGSCLG
jgi:signal transduction histidine kinase/CheY-like chemotaxis protein